MKREIVYPKCFQVRLELADVECLDQVRDPLELSRSKTVRRAIREFLERQLTTQTKSAEQGTSSQGA